MTKEIICTAFSKGKRHDFNVFKNSQIVVKEEIELLADQGYQGIKKYHKKSITPFKKSKKRILLPEEKEANRHLASRRIVVENVIRSLKIFRILSGYIKP